MKASALIAAITVGLTLAGCQRMVDGAANPGIDAAGIERYQVERGAAAALSEALDRLAKRPAVRYTSTGDGKFTLSITRTGAGFGTGTVGGRTIKTLLANGELFIVADAERWTSLGLRPPIAQRYAGEWTKVRPSDVGIDPARTFGPDSVAGTLRAATSDFAADPGEHIDGRAAVVLTSLDDGTRVYRIHTVDGTVDVTADVPHRIAGTDIALGDSRDELGLVGSRTELRPATTADLDGLRTAIGSTLGGLHSTYGFQPSLALYPETMTGSCASDGTCTAQAPVRNRINRPLHRSTSVEVTMDVTMTADGLGARMCSPPKLVMRPNSRETMSCSARFAVPVSTETLSYPVSVRAQLYAVAKLRPDTKSMLANVEKDLAVLAGELGGN